MEHAPRLEMDPARINTVALLHGVWMPRATMAWLAARLRAAGFSTELVGYPSVFGTGEPAFDAVAERLRDADAVVAHSLGGLMTMEALRHAPELSIRRVVCLGSPLAGSAVAMQLGKHRLTRPVLGRSLDLLMRGTGTVETVATGMIAGVTPRGAGRWIARLPMPQDGTVSVAETQVPGLADHLQMPVTHTRLVYSAKVAQQTAHFLRHGRFDHAERAG